MSNTTATHSNFHRTTGITYPTSSNVSRLIGHSTNYPYQSEDKQFTQENFRLYTVTPDENAQPLLSGVQTLLNENISRFRGNYNGQVVYSEKERLEYLWDEDSRVWKTAGNFEEREEQPVIPDSDDNIKKKINAFEENLKL